MDDQTTYLVPAQAVTDPRTRTATLARVGLLGIASAAIVAAAILVAGITAAPGGILAAGSETDPGSAVQDARGFGPGPRGHGPGHGGITITAISGSSISLATADGWTRTIVVDGGTTYTKAGDAIALADLAVGDQVVFRQTLEDDGTWTIDAVAVIPPHAGGKVTAISGSTITVERRDGSTATIIVSGATTFMVNGEAGTLADVEVGMVLMARGTENADGSLAATDVRAGDPRARGDRERGFRGGWGPFGDRLDKEPGATAAPSDSAS